MPTFRAVRFARALALGGGLFGCSSSKSAAVVDPAADAQADVFDARLDAIDAGDAAGGGHCHAPDDDALVGCPVGTACSTDELGGPVCVVPPEDFDAGIQPCGTIGCNRTGSCFCANEMNSFCECSTAVGPLSPPDLPTCLPVS
ncbi:MAG: hypothetical protein ACXWUG_24390 [Polyangiales bacterium]